MIANKYAYEHHAAPHTVGQRFRGPGAHKGWNNRDEEGTANYCLAVTLEVGDQAIPLYEMISAQIELESNVEQRVEV